jgi:NTE family protein
VVQQNSIALVLSGGMGLGAYQAGAYEALQAKDALGASWIAGSSVGAVNAALIAGAEPGREVSTLREFWSAGDLWFPAPALHGHLGHAQAWLSVIHARLFGAAGHFRPRLWSGPLSEFRSLYDLTPMKNRLEKLVDFERVNAGETRLSVAATDIESGELVLFDTGRGTRLTIDHLLASCGFLPEFAPVEIDGRLLGDGGLAANAPIEAIADGGGLPADQMLFIIDLFSRQGPRPKSFEEALARKNDLLFGNQTLLRLEAWSRSGRLGQVIYLCYQPSEDEAGPEKTFDLSRRTITERWAAGARDMNKALKLAASGSPREGITVIR